MYKSFIFNQCFLLLFKKNRLKFIYNYYLGQFLGKNLIDVNNLEKKG